MFSARLPSLEENRLSRLIDLLQKQGTPLIDLTESNPTAVGLDYPADEILAALADPRALEYRPHPRGLASARQAIADHYQRRGHAIDPERLWLTASTSEAYSWLFKLLCNPGEKILVPRPSYPLFEHLASLEGVRVEAYPLQYHAGWFLEPTELAARIDADTRAILVVHPNNPTGHFLKKEELASLVNLCRGRELALISDEVFGDFAWGADPMRAPSLATVGEVLTFALSGLSKPAGLPQLKLGWIHANGPARLLQQASARLDLIADTYLSVSSVVQEAAPRLLFLGDVIGEQIRERVRGNRSALRALVRESAVQLLDGEGGWTAMLRVPRTRTEEEWALALADEDHVLVHPGYFFDFDEEAYLAVSLLVREEELAAGVQKIVARAKDF